MLTTARAIAALESVNLVEHVPRGGIGALVDRANQELRTWGHGDHEVSLERVSPFFGDAAVLHWSFWCESCHVSQIVLVAREPQTQEYQLNQINR